MKPNKVLFALFLIAICSNCANPLFAKDFSKDQIALIKKGVKLSKKLAQDSIEMQSFDKAKKALINKQWILEATQVYGKRGIVMQVNDNTNFIMLEKDKAYLQLAFNGFRSGPNGIGGITLKGYPTKISLKTDKHGNITYTITVFGNGLNADITIWLAYGGNHAEAMVDATFSNGQITFSGQLVSLSDSNYFRSGFDF
jgi:hypothetical protein